MSNNMTNTAKDFPDGSRVQIRRSELENWIGRQSRSPEIWRTRLGTIQGRGNGDSCYVVWDGNNTKQAVWPGWLEIAHNDLPDCPYPDTAHLCKPPAPAMRVDDARAELMGMYPGGHSAQDIRDLLHDRAAMVKELERLRAENAAMAAELAKGKDTGETHESEEE